MTDINQHAARLIDYHQQLVTGGLPPDAAAVLTIDLSKALLASDPVEIPVPDTDERRAHLEASAAAKRERRAAELAQAAP